MLSLTLGGPDGGLVLRDPLTGAAFDLEEAELCDDLRAWLLSDGAEMVPRDAEAPVTDEGFAA